MEKKASSILFLPMGILNRSTMFRMYRMRSQEAKDSDAAKMVISADMSCSRSRTLSDKSIAIPYFSAFFQSDCNREKTASSRP